MELEDNHCLNDYNISECCTLKLVLAMRGGPINTRRVPVEDPLREMAEYMDSNRDEIWEKTSCNKQVTFLVYREGDQLNFFRVLDRGDGTLTPLSESLSGDSVYNLCMDEDEEIEPSPSGQQIIENSITMNKMKLLKAKMENMNLSKKSSRAIGISGNNAAAGKRVGACTHHLPPVKAPIQTKKKTAKQCFLCGKKTGLATSYECRCGNNFCASHRYAETHDCTYDYKSAGRRYLQEANPIVNAPKLPKI